MGKLKRFGVSVPFTGTIYVEVEAENAKDAIEKAFESDDLNLDNAGEWECHHHVTQGNVFYGVSNDAEVVEEFDDEEEEE